jgi:outer membrane protein, heavy metal efflux system
MMRSPPVVLACVCVFVLVAVAQLARAQEATTGPTRLTLDEAIALALKRNHGLQATRTSIAQSQAQEVTAALRPNPVLSVDWQDLPLFSPDEGLGSYLNNSSEIDIGISYTLEIGKRGHRIAAAKDATAVTRFQVADSERALALQAATLFIQVELAESTLELAQENLKSFRTAVDIADSRFKSGGLSENDHLKIKLQLLQFETDLEQAELAKRQNLDNLRQVLGFDSVAPDYDIAGAFDYAPVTVQPDELRKQALENRPDLRAARASVTAAGSQVGLAEVNGRPDVTLSGTYARDSGFNTATVGISVPLPIFDRNQGEIARTRAAAVQAEQQRAETTAQVQTDVKGAYEGLLETDRVVRSYRSGYLDVARRSHDISAYAYQRGGTSLFDFLDAERSYRATELGYRQALAAYLLALEQLRQAVGSRSLP